jgi:hypothetical protein
MHTPPGSGSHLAASHPRRVPPWTQEASGESYPTRTTLLDHPHRGRHRLLQDVFGVKTPAAASWREDVKIPSPPVSFRYEGLACSRENVGPAHPRAPPQPPRLP